MFSSRQILAQVVLTFLLTTTTTAVNALSFVRQATSCNGHPEVNIVLIDTMH